MRQISHYFLNSISVDILETMYWSEAVSTFDPIVCNNSLLNCSKSSSISYDNPPILQSIYPILDSLNINTSNLNDKFLDVVFLKKNYLKSVVF